MPTIGSKDIKHTHRLQSIRLDRRIFKTKENAITKFKQSFPNYTYAYCDETKNQYRFRQVDPVKGWTKRTITLGNGITAIYEFKG